ncbi:DUF692 domain-containing protein [uncultured Psychromonas sp.]|uniref:MNIO family bufferin maturase n=1 Tax=uncultured Psychromonas sp. TaxID=173974 RepID=UPI00260F86AA|nr:DUF692 domain-containing protein [uncultured Psychromonas sp.]
MSVESKDILIGVGLRHVHFTDVLTQPQQVDFVEVHSENFFGEGGAALSVLNQVREKYPISLHSTSMGLGSEQDIPLHYLNRLSKLAQSIDPFLMSEHACFTWGQQQGQLIHSGDLLPIIHTNTSLDRMCEQVDKVQEILGRQLIIENVSAYIKFDQSYLSEAEFLAELSRRTDSKILLDINNIAVNSINFEDGNIKQSVNDYINILPINSVAQIHLAGCTTALPGELVVDDHARPVSDHVWQGYEQALQRFGKIPTLIEWDNDLPEWSVLISEADKARHIARTVFNKNLLNQTMINKSVLTKEL